MASRSKPAAAARAWMMRATVPASMAWVPTTRAGRVVLLGIPPRRHPDPPEHRPLGDPGGVLPAPQGAHRAERRAAERDGDGHCLAVALALGAGQGELQAAVALLEVVDPDGGEFAAAQGAGEADQQQGAVAQAAQIVGDQGDDVAQQFDGGGEFLLRGLAMVGGVAADAGDGLGDPRLGGRHRAAGDEVQVADGGAAELDRGD